MIIPIRCVTCGKVIADKWNKYQELVQGHPEHGKQSDTINVNSSNIQKTVEGKVLDDLIEVI